jgi:signal transduction histidine kinase
MTAPGTPGPGWSRPSQWPATAAAGLLLAALAALLAWETAAGLGHVRRMMDERSGTLTRMVATEVRNVARFGTARLERLDQVLEEVAASPDVDGVSLERDDGSVHIAHGEIPTAAALEAAASAGEPILVGRALVRTGRLTIETQGCGSCQSCSSDCPAHAGSGLAGDYRILLALDATPYLALRRSVWLQGSAGGLLLALLGASLILSMRQARRAAAMREALAVADERARSFERLGAVAGGLAHEIKNPVGSLRGFAQLVAEAAEPGTRQAEYAALMVTELDAITRKIDRLRDVVRPVPPELRPARPAETVRRLAALLEPDLEARSVRLELDLPDDPGPEASLDLDRFRDLAVNLLMNAIEASPEGGTVRVRLAEATAGREIVLEVADEGPGIPEADREASLRPFHSTKPKGLGLGLTLARQAAEDHGGRLEIDATPAGGALLRAVLPRGGAGAA